MENLNTTVRPSLLIVGGPDVDTRIDIMQALSDAFACAAAGTVRHLREPFSEAGFAYHYYPMARGVSPLRDVYTVLCLWRLFRRLRPVMVHTFDGKPCVWARLAAWCAGVPLVVGTIPGLGFLYANERLSTRLSRALYQPLQKWACLVADLTIFQNHDDARQFIRLGVTPAARTSVIPGSGVNTGQLDPSRVSEAALAPTRRALGIAPEALVVCMIARLIRSKGVLEFAEAARSVRESHPEVHFLLVGPSDAASPDRLSSQELDTLSARVNWIGQRGDVMRLLALSDVFVLPSAYREGIPRVLLEAASMGLPLVATDAPGCKEVVVDGENGYLIPVRDAQALAEAIRTLIEQPALRKRFGEASRRLATARFDLKVVAEQTRAAYWCLLNQKKWGGKTTPTLNA